MWKKIQCSRISRNKDALLSLIRPLGKVKRCAMVALLARNVHRIPNDRTVQEQMLLGR